MYTPSDSVLPRVSFTLIKQWMQKSLKLIQELWIHWNSLKRIQELRIHWNHRKIYGNLCNTSKLGVSSSWASPQVATLQSPAHPLRIHTKRAGLTPNCLKTIFLLCNGSLSHTRKPLGPAAHPNSWGVEARVDLFCTNSPWWNPKLENHDTRRYLLHLLQPETASASSASAVSDAQKSPLASSASSKHHGMDDEWRWIQVSKVSFTRWASTERLDFYFYFIKTG